MGVLTPVYRGDGEEGDGRADEFAWLLKTEGSLPGAAPGREGFCSPDQSQPARVLISRVSLW